MATCTCTPNVHGIHHATNYMTVVDVSFPTPDKSFAFLHFALQEYSKNSDILVVLNAPYRRHAIDDRHGNARFITISHPDWVRVAPSISLAVKSQTAIYVRKGILELFDVVIHPEIPDVDMVYVKYIAKTVNSKSCLYCRTNTLPMPISDFYSAIKRNSCLYFEHELETSTSCACEAPKPHRKKPKAAIESTTTELTISTTIATSNVTSDSRSPLDTISSAATNAIPMGPAPTSNIITEVVEPRSARPSQPPFNSNAFAKIFNQLKTGLTDFPNEAITELTFLQFKLDHPMSQPPFDPNAFTESFNKLKTVLPFFTDDAIAELAILQLQLDYPIAPSPPLSRQQRPLLSRSP